MSARSRSHGRPSARREQRFVEERDGGADARELVAADPDAKQQSARSTSENSASSARSRACWRSSSAGLMSPLCWSAHASPERTRSSNAGAHVPAGRASRKASMASEYWCASESASARASNVSTFVRSSVETPTRGIPGRRQTFSEPGDDGLGRPGLAPLDLADVLLERRPPASSTCVIPAATRSARTRSRGERREGVEFVVGVSLMAESPMLTEVNLWSGRCALPRQGMYTCIVLGRVTVAGITCSGA